MESLLNVLLNHSECLFCGDIIPSNIHIKFCATCCSNIININAKLIRIGVLTKAHSVLQTRLGINSRKDFHKWAVRNHPDKGGDPNIFRKVSQLVERQYPK